MQGEFDFEGMKASEENANRASCGWSEIALSELLRCGKKLGSFTIEQVREIAVIDSPPDGRAWGGVVMRASRQNLIARVGFAPAKSSNNSPKPVWVVL